MAESLEDFLKVNQSINTTEVNGSLACQECNEIVCSGYLNEDTMILSYLCSKNHESRIKL